MQFSRKNSGQVLNIYITRNFVLFSKQFVNSSLLSFSIPIVPNIVNFPLEFSLLSNKACNFFRLSMMISRGRQSFYNLIKVFERFRLHFHSIFRNNLFLFSSISNQKIFDFEVNLNSTISISNKKKKKRKIHISSITLIKLY